ncbi:MAG: hypothetical protein WDW36_005300 [Sanguina aurantia]
MELQLFRQDLVQSSTCTQGTLAVLPISDAKKNQKVAVGDLSGVLQVFSIKRGELAIAFKTLPSAKITSLTLGRGRSQRDKIFIAAGETIRGTNNKGKDFFRFNTQLTETIRKVSVLDKHIWSAGEYVHNHFIEGKDNAFYLSPDRINDAAVVPLTDNSELNPVLACQDRQIRVLNGNQILFQAPTQAAPSCISYILASHDPQNRFPDAKELLYGTDSGESASHMVVYDVDENGQLQQVYTNKLTESVNAIAGGFITNVSAPEFIVQTFSGKVISYCQAGGGLLVAPTSLHGLPPKKYSNPSAQEDAERRASYTLQLSKLRMEIDGLRRDVETERNRFIVKNGDTALLAVSAPFSVSDRCKLEPDEACYTLNIESAVPIFTVAIQSTAVLQLLDVPANVAILSKSPTDVANNNMTLATYRCQDSTCRLSIKFKVREGRSSVLQAFIIPQIAPKTCVSVRHQIKALCLHQRIAEPDPARTTSELLITGTAAAAAGGPRPRPPCLTPARARVSRWWGTFTLSDMHCWIGNLLPDVPPAVSQETAGVMVFQNTLLGTQLTCRYKSGEARFYSDLITTLGILHEAIMREATAAKHRADVTFNPSAQSLQHSVSLVWPQLDKCRSLKKQFHLLEGLLELKMQDGDISYLSEEYKAILDSAESITSEHRDAPQHLDHLVALIKDLYLDSCKLTGISTPKQRMPMLEQLLADPRSTLDQIQEFMQGKL